jgi:hypothetical protein
MFEQGQNHVCQVTKKRMTWPIYKGPMCIDQHKSGCIRPVWIVWRETSYDNESLSSECGLVRVELYIQHDLPFFIAIGGLGPNSWL